MTKDRIRRYEVFSIERSILRAELVYKGESHREAFRAFRATEGDAAIFEFNGARLLSSLIRRDGREKHIAYGPGI